MWSVATSLGILLYAFQKIIAWLGETHIIKYRGDEHNLYDLEGVPQGQW